MTAKPTPAHLIEDAPEKIDRVPGRITDTPDLEHLEGGPYSSLSQCSQFLQGREQPVFIIDPQFRILTANTAAKRCVDGTIKNLTGKYCYEVFHGTDHPPASCPLLKILKTNFPEETRSKIDFHQKQYLVHGYPITDDQGKLELFIHIATDISNSKGAEQAPQNTQSDYKEIVEAHHDLICRWTPDTTLTFANISYRNFFGISEDQVSGLKWIDFFSGKQRSACKKFRDKMIRSPREMSYKHPVPDSEGKIQWIRWVAYPLFDEKGNLAEIQSVGQNITDRIIGGKKLKELKTQMFQIQKLESVGRLAGGIAHDFNNLLTVILGAVDLLSLSIETNSHTKKWIDQIFDAGMRAQRLTRQLLAFSRKQVLKIDLLDINKTLRNLKTILDQLIGEDIATTFKLTNESTKIEADQSQIEQVLMNLIINSRDAMPKGGRLFIETDIVEIDKFYASAKKGVKPGNYIMVTISDTGVGIPSKLLSKVFDPFFTTKEKSKGTGLGLSTAYGIIKQHKGNIWVYSEPGMGTTFKIYLPEASNRAFEWKQPKGEQVFAHRPATILVVEDDEVVRDVACSILKQNGYHVIESDSPRSAIELAEKRTGDIHLLLTDIIMPDIKGPEVYRLISDIHPETKVLYMSGYPNAFISSQGIMLEDVQFLQKPLTVNSLLKKIAETLAR